jgi:tetratricopeptide (TPR) repeat protein
MGNDNPQAALEALSAAVKLQPDWSQAHLARAELLVQLDRAGEALEALAETLTEQPDTRPLRVGYARLLIANNRLDEAREQFERLVADDPVDGDSLFALGVLAADAEQFDLAVEYLQKVLALDVRTMDTYYELGKVEELRGNFEQARDWYAQITTGERYLNAQVRVATMEARLGNFPAMAEHFTQLRTSHPDSAIALYIAESEVLREEKRYQMSFDLLDNALSDHPDNHDLLYSRALIAERLDRLDVLERDLRRIVEDDPDNGHALNALGYTLADRTDRYEEALDYIAKALALLPEDAAVLDSMGWVKYRLEDYEAALHYLRQAFEASPDPEIAAHLSEVLWVSGATDEARAVWRESIDQHPEDEHLIEVQERFGL